METQDLIAAVTQALEPDETLAALLLAGSYGRGTADEWSDIDLVAVAAPDHHAALADRFKTYLDAITPVVHWMDRRFGNILVNAVTEDWNRVDFYVVTPDQLTNRAQNTVKPLIDRAGLYDSLPTTLAPSKPNPQAIRSIITEFIRVLGLTPVVLGRNELLTALWGLNLQRDAVQNLLLQTSTDPDKGGALHLSKLLSPDQMDILQALPTPGLTREELIAAHLEIARVFLPLARQIAQEHHIDWPEDFERATRERLKETLNITV